MRILGDCDIDPHAVVLLADIIPPKHLDAHVSGLDLNTRALNGLKRIGVLTIKDLINTPEKTLIQTQNIGERTLREIKAKIKAHILLPGAYQTEQEDVT